MLVSIGEATVPRSILRLARFYRGGAGDGVRHGARSPGGSRTGAEGNLAKLAMSELVRRSRDVGNLIIGADGMLSSSASSFDGRVQEATIFSPAPSIYGGTGQVQRNIVGERVLGLPKEPGPSKETPFKELLQN